MMTPLLSKMIPGRASIAGGCEHVKMLCHTADSLDDLDVNETPSTTVNRRLGNQSKRRFKGTLLLRMFK